MDAKVNSPEADALDLWTALVERYEQQHDVILPPDPIEAIRFRMEQEGLTPTDLVPILGTRSRVSEVLSRKRPLSLAMIRALHEQLGIPAEILIRPSAA
jgi:HTH-type transcriptional regulator / antitoxin HigA